MLGLLPDVGKRCDTGFRAPGDVIVLFGDPTPDLAGSEYLSVVHGRVAGHPRIDLGAEAAVQRLVRDAIGRGLLRSAHDLSSGGLAITLAESAFRGGIGVSCTLDGLGSASAARPDAMLFGEAQSRVLVSVDPEDLEEVARLADRAGVPCARLGVVGGDRLVIGPLDVDLAHAQAAWEHGLGAALFAERSDA
jgi:phosphoribosylformylglycinamidine synthase